MENETRHCDKCNIDKPDRDVHIKGTSGATYWECGDCTHAAFKAKYEPILTRHDSIDTAHIIESYPYGRMRTKMRVWIETTKHGDRFVSQTLNPKTGKWNAPHKSTYTEVGILTRQKDNGFIHWHGIHSGGYRVDLVRFLDFAAGFPFSDAQNRKFAWLRAYYETMKHVTFSIAPVVHRHKVTGEIKEGAIDIMELNQYEQVDMDEHKAQQAETKQSINNLFKYNLIRELHPEKNLKPLGEE
jgi:hypothetical protein